MRPSSTTPARAGTSAVVTTVATVCPVFLVGGLSVQIGNDLHFSPAGLGLAVALYFTASSVASFWSGQLVERVGSRSVGQVAILLSAASLVSIAGLAYDFTTLTAFMVLAGPANSLGQLSSNALLARKIPSHRQGLMFGVKQAAIPLSTTLAGISVPVLALTVGWRWGFVLAAVLALAAWPLLPPPEDKSTVRQRPPRKRPSNALIMITVASALGATAANPLGSFISDFSVTRGMSEAAAGLTVTLGGAAGLVSRVAVGWIADRRSGGRLAMVAIMLTAGAAGLGLLVLPGTALIPLGTAIGFALGWAWPGLVNFAITKRHPDAPAAATGVTQTGVYLGGGLGPLLFGTIVDVWDYQAGWTMMAFLMLLGATLMVVGRRMLLRDLGLA